MVYPDSGQIEWVEFYNDNDFEVILSDWYIDDIANAGSSPKRFTMTIAPKSYGVLDISTAMFNNDFDTISLLDSEELEKNSVSYTSSQKSYSLGKADITSTILCTQNPSKNAINNDCLELTPTVLAAVSAVKDTPSPTLKKTPSPAPSAKKLLPTFPSKKLMALRGVEPRSFPF